MAVDLMLRLGGVSLATDIVASFAAALSPKDVAMFSMYRRAVGCVAAIILLFGGWIYLNRPAHKYRLTITVETPDGAKSASGVFAIYKSKDPPLLPGVGSVAVKGDAILVDLGGGQNLLAILAHGVKGENVDGMVYLAELALSAAGYKVSFDRVSSFSGTIVPVEGDQRPTLISFATLANPATARSVRSDDLGASFGAGFRLSGMALTVLPVGFWPLDFGGALGEPITRRIKILLPWWTNQGRPAAVALRSAGLRTASSIDAEYAFERN